MPGAERDPAAGAAPTLSAAKRALLEHRLRQGPARAPEPGIPRVAHGGRAPASFAQRRLWFLDRLHPGGFAYTVPAVFRLAGPLDVGALERSLGELVRRHESLRTTFVEQRGEPVQVIAAGATVALPVVDLGGLPPAEREKRFREAVDPEAQPPLDLRRGPLLRAALYRFTAGDHRLFLNLHHIVADGWSLSVLVHELAALYAGACAGRPAPLAPPPVQYADFATWQRARAEGGALAAELAYWRRQLAGLPRLDLPTDRPRPRAEDWRGARQAFVVPAALAARLSALGAASGATLSMVLLAAFQAVLRRHAGQDEVVVGLPVANRTAPELEGLVGCLVNTLVLRTDLSGDPPFHELVDRVREVTLQAQAHQEVPFDLLVEELAPEREPGVHPMFQVGFVVQNVPPFASLPMGPVTLSTLDMAGAAAKFDIGVAVLEGEDGLRHDVEYRTGLFDDATITRLVGHYLRTLEAAVEGPGRRLSELPLLTAGERRQLLAEWNDTGLETGEGLFHHLVEEHARRRPGATAVVFDGDRLTYAELNRRANRLAHHLRALGAGPEVLVGVCVERSLDAVVAITGVLKSGAAYVPLDPAYPAERLALMLDDARARLLVTQDHLRGRLPAEGVDVVYIDADAARIAARRDEDPAVAMSPDNLAYVVYTSGSSGRPKGVLVPHRGLHSLGHHVRTACRLRPDDVVLQFASLSFDMSVMDLALAWAHGCALCVASGEERLSGPELARLIREEAVTAATLPPSVLRAMSGEELPALRLLLSGGEACSPDLVARWAPGRRFVNAYGPTETTVGATMGDNRAGAPVSDIGRPWANTRVYVVDDCGEPAPAGLPGELLVGGVGVARGYLGQPGLTAERFVPDPFGECAGARLYRTGDRARWRPEGVIEFLGRIDRQVKVHGYRIEPEEVEAALREHPAVEEAAVLVREDASGAGSLAAYVVLAGAAAPTATELRRFARERLPAYMVPAAFAALDVLPLGPTGKVDRRALVVAGTTALAAEQVEAPPATATERLVASVWQDVLQVDQVGVHDSFFELGGHSFLVLEVQKRLQRRLRREIPVVDLFEHPTVRTLAAHLDRREDAEPDLRQSVEWGRRRHAALRRRRAVHGAGEGER